MKYDLGEKLGKSALTVVEAIMIANNSRDKTKALTRMAIEIDLLWVYLRMALDLQGIKRGEFQVVSEILYEISRQHKNWLAWARKNASSSSEVRQ